jgi:hypothetical protein
MQSNELEKQQTGMSIRRGYLLGLKGVVYGR